MEICSSALRGLIIAPRGKKLVVADLSNIEGRVLAWLVNEAWKVRAFSDFDKGIGHDLYKLTYAKAFGVPVESVTKDLRQIGKVMELAFGYQGGVGAWITFATAYNIDLELMAKTALANIPEPTILEAYKFLEWKRKKKESVYGLSDDAFIMCDSFKRLWREGHPNIATYWKEVQDACIYAVEHPGTSSVVGMHKIRLDGEYLRVQLPSGRYLIYISPRIIDGVITYMGIDQFTRKWTRLRTYGGKIVENITQAVARDVLARGMLNAEKRGFEIVLTVHDEIIAEAEDIPELSVQLLCGQMANKPVWSSDLPLAAAGYEAYRYKKED
jgi:DNA polymerase